MKRTNGHDSQGTENSTKLEELRVLDSELSSLKKGARVYVQQPNSQVFFLSRLPEIRSSVKQQLAEQTAGAKEQLTQQTTAAKQQLTQQTAAAKQQLTEHTTAAKQS
ncbi:uncharacterized protein LOC119110515 [Pollicipes pollicipes]|uniref:uncharacterized protein LOC119110515 n=1 Tax=Pollicipes pollicipes TaxID=41117 RepID=UPI001885317B|nr:uncharacterized protein LOC119110515 [Pollicipes pollicipes]